MAGTETPITPESELESLRETGADRFDPVRFRFIETLLHRSTGHEEPVATQLEDRALAAIDEYRARLEQARDEAAATVARLVIRFPDDTGDAQALFEAGDFRQLRRTAYQMERNASLQLLAALTQRIVSGDSDTDDDAGGDSFDDLLRQQEDDIVSSLSDNTPGQSASARGAAQELKSVRQFRSTMAKLNADKLVKQAVGEAPPDCGPLNPQMLAIRSLTAMSDLSPHYLTRFVSYVDTLFWLEQAGEQVKS